MSTRIGLLGLGSNVGDRRAHLQAAVDALASVAVRVLVASSAYDTDPVGEVLDQPNFLNACVRIETSLRAPAALWTRSRRWSTSSVAARATLATDPV